MKNQKKNAVPVKQNLNLCMHEDHSASIRLLVIGIVLIALLAGAVAKVGVIDQYARLNAAADEYNKVHSQLEKLDGILEKYDEVEADYRTHAMDWLKDHPDSAYVSVDRMQVLDLVEQKLMTCGTIRQLTVFGVKMNVTMTMNREAKVSELILDLESSPIVSEAIPNSILTEDDDYGVEVTTLSITILLQAEEVDGK